MKRNLNEETFLGYQETAPQDLEEKNRLDQALLEVEIRDVLPLKSCNASRRQSHYVKEVGTVYVVVELERLSSLTNFDAIDAIRDLGMMGLK